MANQLELIKMRGVIEMQNIYTPGNICPCLDVIRPCLKESEIIAFMAGVDSMITLDVRIPGFTHIVLTSDVMQLKVSSSNRPVFIVYISMTSFDRKFSFLPLNTCSRLLGRFKFNGCHRWTFRRILYLCQHFPHTGRVFHT